MDQSFVTRLIKLCEFVLRFGNDRQGVYANGFKERLENQGNLTPNQLATLKNMVDQIVFYLDEIEVMEKLASRMLKTEQVQMALRLVKSG